MIKRYVIFFCCVLMTGCSSLSHKSNHNVGRIASAYLAEHAAIEVKEVYRVNDNIFLRFQIFTKNSDLSRVFYGSFHIPEDNPNETSQIQFILKEKWQQSVKHAVGIQSMPAEFWREFRVKLAHKITPQEPNSGVIIRGNKEELFLYYQDDVLQAVDAKDKPEDVKTINIYNQKQLAQMLIDELIVELKHNDEKIEQVLLVTSNEDDFVNLFLYVDIKNKRAFDLAITPDESVYEGSFVKNSMKSADQLIVQSHILGLMTRPFSSGYRLFSWAKGTTYDVVKPKAVDLLEKIPIPVLSDKLSMNLKDWEKHLDSLVGNNLSKGEMDFLIDGEAFFERLVEELSKAEKSIDFRIFIFDNDDYAVKIADLLKKKAEEGVKVRVLLDNLGSVMGEGKVSENLPKGFKPPDSMIKYLKDSKIEVRVRPSAWFKADHIKTIIIDKKLCFTGGMNIGREYRYDWHDMMMLIKGEIVNTTLYEFDIAWAHAGHFGDLGYLISRMKKENYPQPDVGYPIRPLFTKANNPQIFIAQVEAIKRAQKYIYINNAYFSDNTILYEIIKARRRGVDVRVILPSNGNHEIMNASNIVTANTMFKNGIRVFFYPGMSHIKAAVYDGWLITGSANFDKLSLKDNLEFNLATSDEKAVKYLIENLFEKDFKRSLEMNGLLKEGLKRKIAGFLAEQL